MFTDIGGDVDDAAALVSMAVTDPQLALVVTVDEYPDGRRSKLARHLLDLLGRSDVRVVAGLSLGASGYWAADGLFPADLDLPHVDLYDVMSELCEAGSKSVRCLSLGPLTDNARLLITDTHRAAPLGLERLLRVTAMGGALQYRKPERAEHNWRMNPAAVQTVLAEVEHVALVLSDHTFVDEIAVSASSPIYRLLNSRPERWAQLLRAHYDQFFAASTPPASSTTRSPPVSSWASRSSKANNSSSAWLATHVCNPAPAHRRGCPPACRDCVQLQAGRGSGCLFAHLSSNSSTSRRPLRTSPPSRWSWRARCRADSGAAPHLIDTPQ
ncbi:nucleoside hydrolase [Nocardia africana]|uniref:Nucleoside hydrolase n=1 Tax=Nocardia africana TaxID=134964 RepID=A0ABW6NCU7_9NOCA